MKLKVRKINLFVNLIGHLLKSTDLSYEDRKNLRKAKDELAEAILGSSTKINHAQEIYTEMSKHKVYVESETKAKELLEKKQEDIEGAQNTEIDITFKPFDFSTKFTGENAIDFRAIATELEDYVLTIVEPKK
jgi:hypothetical protein